MPNKARDYKRITIRRLDTLSGNECAAPNCSNKLLASDGQTIISKICHIEAASQNGPRYNPDMTDDERRHFDNLILLCDGCHNIIDNKENESKYPVELLKEWKRNHEGIRQYSILTQKTSLLDLAVNAISEYDFDDFEESLKAPTAFNPEEKIKFNSIKRNKSLIREYSEFFPKINAIYNELESQGSFRKERLLRNIKMLYSRIKGKYILDSDNGIEIIQRNADNIFEDVENQLLEMIDNAITGKDEIAFAVPVILVDAFMRCKILENPRLYDNK